MAEPGLQRRSAIAPPDRVGHKVRDAAVALAEVPHTAKLNLRGDPADRAFMTAVGKTLGMVLPTEPNNAAASGGVTAFWLGPDEWLLTGEAGAEGPLLAQLREALANLNAAIVDVTENSTIIRLSGPRAREVLAKGCPLDLHPRLFGPGRVAQSIIGPVDLVLHQTGDDAYDLYVRRSFADYLWRWLDDAGLEYGVAVTAGAVAPVMRDGQEGLQSGGE